METPEQILGRALDEYQPAHVFALFSGGDDSLTVSHFTVTTLGERLTAIVHINTGIGLKETRQHVDTVCALLGWRLLEYSARDQGEDYEQIVLTHGFPGPSQHSVIYRKLKERAVEALTRDHQGGKVLLISGARQQESTRRMGLRNPIRRDKGGRRVWCAPFFYMSNDEVREYRTTVLAHVPKNPAKEYLCMSGECLCGAFARKGELSQIDAFFPEMGRYLHDLQARVRARGFPWNWDEGPPRWWRKRLASQRSGQYDAFDAEFQSEVQMLCTSCQFRHDMDASQ